MTSSLKAPRQLSEWPTPLNYIVYCGLRTLANQQGLPPTIEAASRELGAERALLEPVWETLVAECLTVNGRLIPADLHAAKEHAERVSKARKTAGRKGGQAKRKSPFQAIASHQAIAPLPQAIASEQLLESNSTGQAIASSSSVANNLPDNPSNCSEAIAPKDIYNNIHVSNKNPFQAIASHQAIASPVDAQEPPADRAVVIDQLIVYFPAATPTQLQELGLLCFRLNLKSAESIAGWDVWSQTRHPGRLRNEWWFKQTIAQFAGEKALEQNFTVGQSFILSACFGIGVRHSKTLQETALSQNELDRVRGQGARLDVIVAHIGLNGNSKEWVERGLTPARFEEYWVSLGAAQGGLKPSPESVTKYFSQFIQSVAKEQSSESNQTAGSGAIGRQ